MSGSQIYLTKEISLDISEHLTCKNISNEGYIIYIADESILTK